MFHIASYYVYTYVFAQLTPVISTLGRGRTPALFFLLTASEPIQFYSEFMKIHIRGIRKV